jgi:hypothetical protein
VTASPPVSPSVVQKILMSQKVSVAAATLLGVDVAEPCLGDGTEDMHSCFQKK